MAGFSILITSFAVKCADVKLTISRVVCQQEYSKLIHELDDLQRADVNRRRQGLEKLPVSAPVFHLTLGRQASFVSFSSLLDWSLASYYGVEHSKIKYE